MLNKLFTSHSEKSLQETVNQQSLQKQKQRSKEDIYIALSKYTSIGGKRFKIGIFPRIPERGVVLGLISATAEKGGIALSLGKAMTRDEEIAEGIHEAQNPWYKRVNVA
ncbi:MAG: hypothetical protein LBD75_03745 [Candidatus Peribacteria bacterium]|nr:hypothetical protein [Candidatus Peribacteria bacterium]